MNFEKEKLVELIKKVDSEKSLKLSKNPNCVQLYKACHDILLETLVKLEAMESDRDFYKEQDEISRIS